MITTKHKPIVNKQKIERKESMSVQKIIKAQKKTEGEKKEQQIYKKPENN